MEWCVNREAKAFCIVNQFFVPQTHFLAAPAGDGFFVDAELFVRHDQIFVNAYDISEPAACRTSAEGIVEIKQMFAGFNERDAVRFETLREGNQRAFHVQHTFAFALKERSLHRVSKAIGCGLLAVCYDAVHQQIQVFSVFYFADTQHVAVLHHARETLSRPHVQLLFQRYAF